MLCYANCGMVQQHSLVRQHKRQRNFGMDIDGMYVPMKDNTLPPSLLLNEDSRQHRKRAKHRYKKLGTILGARR